MIYRRFYTNSNSQTLLKLYVSFVRPHLEYCSPVWNPHSKRHIEELERVQKFALKVCTKSWDSSYETLLATTNLATLESRRERASLCHLFKIINNLTHYPEPPTKQQESHYNTRSSGSTLLTVPKSNTAYHQHSFFPSTINRWNKLLKETKDCNSIISFKHSLSK